MIKGLLNAVRCSGKLIGSTKRLNIYQEIAEDGTKILKSFDKTSGKLVKLIEKEIDNNNVKKTRILNLATDKYICIKAVDSSAQNSVKNPLVRSMSRTVEDLNNGQLSFSQGVEVFNPLFSKEKVFAKRLDVFFDAKDKNGVYKMNEYFYKMGGTKVSKLD